MVAIQRINAPIIETGVDSGYPFLNRHFVLRDKNDLRKKLYLKECRMSWKEWDAGKVDNCIIRIESTEKKFNMWLKDEIERRLRLHDNKN